MPLVWLERTETWMGFAFKQMADWRGGGGWPFWIPGFWAGLPPPPPLRLHAKAIGARNRQEEQRIRGRLQPRESGRRRKSSTRERRSRTNRQDIQSFCLSVSVACW